MKPKIVDTGDGSKTIYLEEIDEQYHSLNGAFTESEHVFLKNGFQCHSKTSPTLLEIGFGTGLNCLLTAIEAKKQNRITTYFGVEKFPVEKKLIQELNYGSIISAAANKVFQKIHSCEWGKTKQITPFFYLHKLNSDLISDELDVVPPCDIVYFDAFGPDKQPEMWTAPVFGKIFEKLKPGGIIVTYSAKGEVRRRLAAIGFIMERLPGPPGKRQMLRGIKPESNI